MCTTPEYTIYQSISSLIMQNEDRHHGFDDNTLLSFYLRFITAWAAFFFPPLLFFLLLFFFSFLCFFLLGVCNFVGKWGIMRWVDPKLRGIRCKSVGRHKRYGGSNMTQGIPSRITPSGQPPAPRLPALGVVCFLSSCISLPSQLVLHTVNVKPKEKTTTCTGVASKVQHVHVTSLTDFTSSA